MRAANRLGPKSNWTLAVSLSAILHIVFAFLLTWIPFSVPASSERIRTTLTLVTTDDLWDAASESIVYFPPAGANAIPSDSSKTDAAAQGKRLARKAPFEPVLQPAIPGNSYGEQQEPPTVAANGKDKKGLTPTNGNGAGKGKSGGHGNATTSFFQIPVRAQKIVYVIDRSSSMGKGGALQVACQELLASLQLLPEDASFQIIVYNSIAHHLIQQHQGWFAATWENKRRAARELLRLEPTKGTVHKLALPLALALRPDVIFFLTDADDLEPHYVQTITARNQGRAVIHVIELSTSNSRRLDSPLQTFARQNRGLYRAVELNWYR